MSENNSNVQVEELVDLYNGNVAPRSECFKFTIGQYDDQWYHKDDEDIITLQSGSVCHTDDEDDVFHTTCGDAFHADEQHDSDIVWCEIDEVYAYQSDC